MLKKILFLSDACCLFQGFVWVCCWPVLLYWWCLETVPCCGCCQDSRQECCECWDDTCMYCTMCCDECCLGCYKAVCCKCGTCIDEDGNRCQCCNKKTKGNCCECCSNEECNGCHCSECCYCNEKLCGVQCWKCVCPEFDEDKQSIQCQLGCKDCMCLAVPCPTCKTPVYDTSNELYYDVTFNNLLLNASFANKCICEESEDDNLEIDDVVNKKFWCCSFGQGFLLGLLVECVWCRWSRQTRYYECHCEALQNLWNPVCYGKNNCCTFLLCESLHAMAESTKIVWKYTVLSFFHLLVFIAGFFLSLVCCMYSVMVSCCMCLTCNCDHPRFCNNCACLCFICRKLDSKQIQEIETQNEDQDLDHWSCLCWYFRCKAEDYQWCGEELDDKTPPSTPPTYQSPPPSTPDQPVIHQDTIISQPSYKHSELSIDTSDSWEQDSDSVFYVNELAGYYGDRKHSVDNHLDVVESKKRVKNAPPADVMFYPGSGRAGSKFNKSLSSSSEHSYETLIPGQSSGAQSGFSSNLSKPSISQPSNDVVVVEYDHERSPSLHSVDRSKSPLYANIPSPLYANIPSREKSTAVNETQSVSSSHDYETLNSPVYVNEIVHSKKKLERKSIDNVHDYENVFEPRKSGGKKSSKYTPQIQNASSSEYFAEIDYVNDNIGHLPSDYYINVLNLKTSTPKTLDKSHKKKKTVSFEEPVHDTGTLRKNLFAEYESKTHPGSSHSSSNRQPDLGIRTESNELGSKQLSKSRSYRHSQQLYENLHGKSYQDAFSDSSDEIYSVPYSGNVPRIDWQKTNKPVKRSYPPGLDLELDISKLSRDDTESEKDTDVDTEIPVKKTISERLRNLREKRTSLDSKVRNRQSQKTKELQIQSNIDESFSKDNLNKTSVEHEQPSMSQVTTSNDTEKRKKKKKKKKKQVLVAELESTSDGRTIPRGRSAVQNSSGVEEKITAVDQSVVNDTNDHQFVGLSPNTYKRQLRRQTKEQLSTRVQDITQDSFRYTINLKEIPDTSDLESRRQRNRKKKKQDIGREKQDDFKRGS